MLNKFTDPLTRPHNAIWVVAFAAIILVQENRLHAAEDIVAGTRILCITDGSLRSPGKSARIEDISAGDVLKVVETGEAGLLLCDDVRYGWIEPSHVRSLTDPEIDAVIDQLDLTPEKLAYVKGMSVARVWPEKALAHFQEVLSQEPDNWRAALSACLVRQRRGDGTALADIKKLYESQPNNVSVALAYAELRNDSNFTRQMSEHFPNCHAVWRLLGVSHLKSDDPARLADASDCFLKALEICPHDSKSHTQQAIADLRMWATVAGELKGPFLERGKMHALQAIKLDPWDTRAYALVSEFLCAEGYHGRAVRILQTSLGLDPLSDVTVSQLARVDSLIDWKKPGVDIDGISIKRSELDGTAQLSRDLSHLNQVDLPLRLTAAEINRLHHGERTRVGRLHDENGDTLLHSFVDSGAARTISHLNQVVDLDLDITNGRGDTPLHTAVRNKNFVLTGQLVQLGANVNLENESGLSPVDLAVRFKLDLLVHCLLQTEKLSVESTETLATWFGIEVDRSLAAIREASSERVMKQVREFVELDLIAVAERGRKQVKQADTLRKDAYVKSLYTPRSRAPIVYPEGYHTDIKYPNNNANRRLMRRLNEEARQQQEYEDELRSQRLDTLENADKAIFETATVVQENLLVIDALGIFVLTPAELTELREQYADSLEEAALDLGFNWYFPKPPERSGDNALEEEK